MTSPYTPEALNVSKPTMTARASRRTFVILAPGQGRALNAAPLPAFPAYAEASEKTVSR
jgi:hypothetical protein